MWAARRTDGTAQFVQHHRCVQVSLRLRRPAGHIQCFQPGLAGDQQKFCESAISLGLFERMVPRSSSAPGVGLRLGERRSRRPEP